MSESHRTAAWKGVWKRPEMVVGLCIVLAYVLVWPVGDYVIEDDWAFSLTLHHLHENGEVRILHWNPHTLVVHLFWGLLFTKVLGFHLTLLKITTVLLMAAGTWSVMDLLRRLDVRPGLITMAGLAGAPHLVDNDIDISNLTEPLRVFHGSAREAARGFPANVNVAAALALAGIGPDRTEVEVWADPATDRNIQSVTIISDSGEATMTMRNIPSTGNPRTGRIVANSVLATLRRLTATLTAGS